MEPWLSSSYITSRLSPRLLLIPNLSSAENLYVGNTISITLPHTFISRNHRPPNHPVSLSLASALPRRWRFSPYSSPSSYTPHGIGRPIPSSRAAAAAAASGGGGWLSVFGAKNKNEEFYPDIVKAGDPVLHEPARDVKVEEIASDSIQKIVDDMIRVMRKAPGVGLAAPQIGVPLKIIVLEDTKEYVSYVTKGELEAQDRRPFDLLVMINPTLKKKGCKTALFFEGCLSVDGFRAIVERHLEVEATGLDRNGHPIKLDVTGWQARILQHECDHLDGTIYVDRMLPRTFRTVENLALPLPAGCPKLGAR